MDKRKVTSPISKAVLTRLQSHAIRNQNQRTPSPLKSEAKEAAQKVFPVSETDHVSITGLPQGPTELETTPVRPSPSSESTAGSLQPVLPSPIVPVSSETQLVAPHQHVEAPPTVTARLSQLATTEYDSLGRKDHPSPAQLTSIPNKTFSEWLREYHAFDLRTRRELYRYLQEAVIWAQALERDVGRLKDTFPNIPQPSSLDAILNHILQLMDGHDRRRMSKERLALRVLQEEGTGAHKIATELENRGGYAKLANEHAKRRGSKKTVKEETQDGTPSESAPLAANIRGSTDSADLGIPPFLDRRPLSAEAQLQFDELVQAWAKACELVRDRFRQKYLIINVTATTSLESRSIAAQPPLHSTPNTSVE